MNALFVNACMRENSRTKVLCEAYIRTRWKNPDMDIKELELYKEFLIPLDRERLLRRERDIADANLLAAEYRYAREFAAADEILIGAPYWDCSFPALLKIYLEQICVNGITFRYGADGRPIKICMGKKLVFITTAGGYLCENSSLELYWKGLCGLFGIPEMLFLRRKDWIFRGMIPGKSYKGQ